MHNLDPSPGPAGPDKRRRPGAAERRAAIHRNENWHIDDGTGTDGGEPYHKNVIRRAFSPEYKLAILAEYDRCSESGEKGAILRREGLYSSLITEWRRARDAGALAGLKQPQGRPADDPRDAEIARLRKDKAKLEQELAKARFVADVQSKLQALLETISEGADTEPRSKP